MAWELLDTAELRRNRLRREHGREIVWEVSLRTRMRFRELLAELVDLELEPQEPEVVARMEALREDIRSLPGFPKGYHEDRDVIVPVTTSTQR